jgi:hypothetical protein
MALPPIRPDAFPTPPARPAADAARLAAQRAFFDAALGRAGAPAQANPAQASAPAATTPAPFTVRAQPVQRLPDPGAEPPAKPLRPGSLLDIRV